MSSGSSMTMSPRCPICGEHATFDASQPRTSSDVTSTSRTAANPASVLVCSSRCRQSCGPYELRPVSVLIRTAQPPSGLHAVSAMRRYLRP